MSTGYDDIISFSKMEYRQVYDLLYNRIETDYHHPEHGNVVRQRVEELKGNVMFTQIPSS